LINSEKICSFEKSKMIKSLYRSDEELKDIIKSIKYFEEFIQKNYKNEEKFELFTENMITLITLGIYILINDENNVNDLCKSEEEALLGFLGVNKLKSEYTKEEEKIVNLNQDIFLYGNIKDINDISKEELLNIIKSISIYSKVKMNENKHHTMLCKFASHLYSPCVTKCCACGLSFITDEEIDKVKKNENLKEITENIKNRKYKHIQEYAYTTNNFGFNEYTNIFPGHKIVRIACTMDKFKDIQRPTRELILEEIKMFNKINRNSRGNIYYEKWIEDLVIFSWDFLQRKKNLSEKELKKLNNNCLTFEERVLIEVNEPQDDFVEKEATLDGLTPEEIKELTQNVNMNDINN
jgi:hypothetical protein